MRLSKFQAFKLTHLVSAAACFAASGGALAAAPQSVDEVVVTADGERRP